MSTATERSGHWPSRPETTKLGGRGVQRPVHGLTMASYTETNEYTLISVETVTLIAVART
jgi:hypothetical protein